MAKRNAEHVSFRSPHEVRKFPGGKADIVRIATGEVGRLEFLPGWRWSKDMKALANTPSCHAPHFQYHVSGRLAIRMDDGDEFVAEAGDVTALPVGHDAWVVGEESVVVVDWCGASEYGKAAKPRRAGARAAGAAPAKRRPSAAKSTARAPGKSASKTPAKSVAKASSKSSVKRPGRAAPPKRRR